MALIELGNLGSESQAEKVKNALQGKTYMNFKVQYSPDAGNYPTVVFTDYTDNEDAVKDVVLFILACEI
jgi:hypothetical protein